MNDLTNTPFSSGTATMSSREIAELTGSRHDSVRRTVERLAEKAVIQLPPLVEVTNHLGQKVLEYIFSGEAGKRDSYIVVAQLCPEFTARIVDRWQELEARPQIDPQIALSDPATLRGLLLENVEKVLALESKVAVDAPKVAFADQVQAAPDAITIGQAAKTLGTGRNRLMSRLREMGWVTRLGEPYQSKINAGLLDVKVGSWEHPEKGLQRSVTALVTGKGLARLHREIDATAH